MNGRLPRAQEIVQTGTPEAKSKLGARSDSAQRWRRDGHGDTDARPSLKRSGRRSATERSARSGPRPLSRRAVRPL